MKKQVILLIAASVLLWKCTDHVQLPVYQLDATKSVAEWKGYLKTGYFNEGSIAVQSESITVSEGKITGGTLSLPLSSILNFNLPTPEVKQELVHHLQSADFFNMALHPELKFEINSVTAYSGSGDGVVKDANFMVNGMLTMVGKMNPVTFPAKIIFNGDAFSVEGKVKVDRTKWGIVYGTDQSTPAEAIIEPFIDIYLKLAGNKK